MIIDPIKIGTIAKTAIDVIKFINEVTDDMPEKESKPIEVVQPQQPPTIINNFNFYMMGDVEQNKEAIVAAANEMSAALSVHYNPFAMYDSIESK